MNIDHLKKDARGQMDFGWLKTAHSFSFGGYYNPERLGFGKLLVVNDDWVAPGSGFDTHPHRDMEIISIPLAGALSHKDTMGHEHTIKSGEIQVMSAGTGVAHSEYNHSNEAQVNFLQIWILPDQLGLKPSYQQKQIEQVKDQWQVLVSPDKRDGSLKIHQDALISMLDTKNNTMSYRLNDAKHGVYVFVLDGKATVGEHILETRDAIMLTEVEGFDIDILEASKILVIEVPLQ